MELELLEQAKLRLASFGCQIVEEDQSKLEYNVSQAIRRLLAATNREDLPIGLLATCVDLAVGLFLQENQKAPEDRTVQEIKEGDVSVKFGNDADPLQAQIKRMLCIDPALIARYRRLLW